MDGKTRGAHYRPWKKNSETIAPESGAPLFSLKILASLILLISCSFAVSCVQNAGQKVMDGAGPIIIVAAFLSVAVIAIAYMYGSAMGNAHSIVFAKDELYHLGFSLVLVLSISGIIASSCLVTGYIFDIAFSQLGGGLYNSCGGSGAELGDLQSCTISQAISDAEMMTTQFTAMDINSMMSANWAYTYAVPFSDVVTTVASGYKKTYAMQYETLTNTFVLPALVSLKMQKVLVGLLSRYSIEIILPLGFIFRMVPPVRRFGNFLLALSLGLYIVIPFFTTFNYLMYDAVNCACNDYSSILHDTVLDNNGAQYGFGIHECGVACSSANGFWTVARLIPQAFFLPNLTLALFVTFLSAINKALSVIG